MVAILGFTKDQIFSAVRQMYSEVAASPSTPFHFPVGRSACLFVGYPEELIDGVPTGALKSFAGVGFPFRAGVIKAGDHVLDVGAGSGTDTLIAARLVGSEGKVLALDMTPAMISKLRSNIALANATNVEVIEGNAESIPLPDASVDLVTSNGVLNLVPDKAKAVAEIFRVLRPGGRVQIADIVLSWPVGEERRADAKLWAECVVGASVDEDYLDLFRSSGFAQVTDCAASTISPPARARIPGASPLRLAAERRRSPCRSRRRGAPSLPHRRNGCGRPSLHAARPSTASWARSPRSLLSRPAMASLALVGAIGLLGLSIPLNAQVWTAMIVALAVLAPLGIAWNMRAHGSWGPTMIGAAGALLVCYALLGAYDWRVEASGFAAMLGAALWDRHLFRRAVNC